MTVCPKPTPSTGCGNRFYRPPRKLVLFPVAVCHLLLWSVCWSASSGNRIEIVPQVGQEYIAQVLPVPGRNWIVAMSEVESTIQIWDVDTRLQLRSLAVQHLRAMAIDSRGRFLIAAVGDFDDLKEARFFDIPTGREVGRLRIGKSSYDPKNPSARIDHLAMGDGRTLVVQAGGTIALWRVEVDKPWIPTSPQPFLLGDKARSIEAFAVNPDTGLIGEGDADGTIRIWNLNSAQPVTDFKGDFDHPSAMALTSVGDAFAVGSRDGRIAIRKIGVKAEPLTTLSSEQSDSKLSKAALTIDSLAFGPDGRVLAAGVGNVAVSHASNHLEIWETTTWKRATASISTYVLPATLAFNPNGTSVFSNNDTAYPITPFIGGLAHENTNAVGIWDISSGKLLGSLRGAAERISVAHYEPHSNRIIVIGRDTDKLWDLDQMKVVRTITPEFGADGDVAISPDGKNLKAYGLMGQAAYDPTGTLIAAGANSFGIPTPPVEIRSVASGELQKTIQAGAPFAFRPGQSVIACSKEGGVQLSSTDLGVDKPLLWLPDPLGALERKSREEQQKCEAEEKAIDAQTPGLGSPEACVAPTGFSRLKSDVAFSSDGRTLALAYADGETVVWNIRADGLTSSEPRVLHGDLFATKLAFNPHSPELAVATKEGTITFWNYKTGERLAVVEAHAGWIGSLGFSEDGSRLISASRDGSVKIWDSAQKKLLCTLISSGPGREFIVTPKGYYSGSRQALSGVAMRVGDQIYGFEQFDLRLNRPDLVLQELGVDQPSLIAAYHEAYLKRLKRSGMTEERLVDDLHIPKLEVVSEVPGITNDSTLPLKVSASDANAIVRGIMMTINGVPAQNLDVSSEKKHRVLSQLNAKLSSGSNLIRIWATSTSGASGRSVVLNVTCDAKEESARYIFAIGISDYSDSRLKLRSAAKDAHDIASLFGGSENAVNSTVNSQVHTKVLTAATRDEIMALRAQLSASKVQDSVILFLAGHGFLDKRYDYYFGTVDIDPADPSKRGLAYDDIEVLLDSSPAREKLLMMDTCFSGEEEGDAAAMPIASTSKSQNLGHTRGAQPMDLGLDNAFRVMQDVFADLKQGSGAVVISASAGNETAGESSQNGYFTQAVLEALRDRQATADGLGNIHVAALRDYVSERVEQTTGGRQHPTARQENLDNDWVILPGEKPAD
jgi:WD40 repeat protein